MRKSQPEFEQLRECTRDHTRMRTGWRSCRPWQMRHGQFFDRVTHSARLDQELGAEGCTSRFHLQALPDASPKEFEGAIDVPRGVAKEAVHEEFPTPRVQQSHWRIGAFGAEPD